MSLHPGCDNFTEKHFQISTQYDKSKIHLEDKYLMIRCDQCLVLLDIETGEEVVTSTDNIQDIIVTWPHAVIISDYAISVIDYSNLNNNNAIKRYSSNQKLVSGAKNEYILAVLDITNAIHLFKWKDLIQEEDSQVNCFHSFSLPFPTCEFTHPCLAVAKSSILVAQKGSNIVYNYCVLF